MNAFDMKFGLPLAYTLALLLLLKPGHAAAEPGNAATIVTPTDKPAPSVASSAPRLFTTEGYPDLINTITVSPDGRTMVSAGERVMLWDIATRQLVQIISSIESETTKAVFSPDGQSLAIDYWNPETQEQGVQVWSLEHGQKVSSKPLWTFNGFEYAVGALWFSADGKNLVGLDYKGIPYIWDAQTGVLAETVKDQPKAPSSPVAISRDEHRIATVSLYGESVELRNSSTGKVVRTLDSNNHVHPNALAISSDNQLLAMGGAGNAVEIWDIASGKRLAAVKTHHNQAGPTSVAVRKGISPQSHSEPKYFQISAICFSPDRRILVCGNDDESIFAWDIRDVSRPKPLGSWRDRHFTGLRPQDVGITSLCFVAPGVLAKSTKAGDLSLWSVNSQGKSSLAQRLIRRSYSVNALKYSPDGKTLVSATDDGLIRLYDTGTGRPLKTLLGHKDSVTAIHISPDGQTLATVSQDFTTRVWDFRSGKIKHVFRTPKEPVQAVAFSPDNQVIATAGVGGAIRFWDSRTFRLQRTMRRDYGGIHGLSFSSDGKMLASGGEGGVYLWQPSTGKLLKRIGPLFMATTAIAFSPDNKTIAANGATLKSNGVHLWDVATNTLRATLNEHGHRFMLLAFSPDERTLASAADVAEFAQLLDIRSGKVRHKIPLDGPINTLAFSPSGNVLALGNSDGTIQLLSSKSGEDIASFWALPSESDGKPSDDWIIFGPGDTDYYNASVGARRWIRWRVGNEVFPAEEYEKQFLRPDLIQPTLTSARDNTIFVMKE